MNEDDLDPDFEENIVCPICLHSICMNVDETGAITAAEKAKSKLFDCF